MNRGHCICWWKPVVCVVSARTSIGWGSKLACPCYMDPYTNVLVLWCAL